MSNGPTKDRFVGVRMPNPLYRALRLWAQHNDVSVSKLIRSMLVTHLEASKPPRRDV